jgi:hypothetical protein
VTEWGGAEFRGGRQSLDECRMANAECRFRRTRRPRGSAEAAEEGKALTNAEWRMPNAGSGERGGRRDSGGRGGRQKTLMHRRFAIRDSRLTTHDSLRPRPFNAALPRAPFGTRCEGVKGEWGGVGGQRRGARIKTGSPRRKRGEWRASAIERGGRGGGWLRRIPNDELHSSARLEHSSPGLEQTRARMEHSCAGLEHSSPGLEHSRARMEHSCAGLEHSSPGLEQTKARMEHSCAGLEHSRG